MTITENKVVSLVYELRKSDDKGEVLESLNPDAPLTFIYGSGQLLPKFEENINGSKVGDKFQFTLTSTEAYGEFNQEAVVDLPKNIFEQDGKLNEDLVKVGNMIPMQDNNGNRLNGLVKEIADETIKMDFNHPLVGETLHFSGEVTDVREANAEELEHGHIHQDSCGSCSCEDGNGCN